MKVKQKIIEEINTKKNGIPIDKFIEICLFEQNGYYTNSKPIGKKGDFITSPEISQLFGEILGLYIYNCWQKNLRTNFNLIELGPGKGTLISDILRITKSFTQFTDSMNIHLIEINNNFIKLQKKYIKKSNINLSKVTWHNIFDTVSNNPSIIYANEFFDCLPIKQFIKIDNMWYEKKISLNKISQKLFIQNSLVNSNSIINKLDNHARQWEYQEGQIIEISPQREKYFDKLCKFIKKNSGIIIVFDYGYNSLINYSSLQSIHNHNQSHIFDNLGLQDITSLVNFINFEEISKKNKLNFFKLTSQKEFFCSNGIEERKNKILLKCNKIEKKNIISGFERLTSDNQMGSIFKCVIISDKNFDEE